MPHPLAILVVIVVILVACAATKPNIFRVSRSAKISAPVASVFNRVNDLHQWHDWSPWARLDPNAKTTFEGPTFGVGARMHWDSAISKVGKGSMAITESRPDEYIQLKLNFLKPMVAENMAEFSLKAEGNSTIVTWSMSGKTNFIGKLMDLIFNCEKMVGTQFENGLSNLNALLNPPK